MSHMHFKTAAKTHAHKHAHGASAHEANSFGGRFLIAACVNAAFIAAEIAYGFKANSLALLADSGHNFGDVVGLMISWGAWWLSRKKPTERYTYGLRSASILASLMNAIMLLLAVASIDWHAIVRFGSETPVQSTTIIWIASIGIVVNASTAWLFSKGHDDLNIKAAFLHLASDAAISVGVVVAGFVIGWTGWVWLDPSITLVISFVIIVGTWGLLRDALKLALHAVPTDINPSGIKQFLLQLPGVVDVHDLHIWGMSTSEVALTAHLHIPSGHPGDMFFEQASSQLSERFKIDHTTLQIETDNEHHSCTLASDLVV